MSVCVCGDLTGQVRLALSYFQMLYCEVMTMKTSKPLSLLLSLLTALAVLSGSIAAPLLCRPFYYAHIDALGWWSILA